MAVYNGKLYAGLGAGKVYVSTDGATWIPSNGGVAISPNARVVGQLALCWGVSPLLGTTRGSFEEVVHEANDLVLASGFGERGQVVVITAGLQTNQSGKTNLIKAHMLE